MAVASEAKATAWRAEYGVQDDTDFAFYFTSHGEATVKPTGERTHSSLQGSCEARTRRRGKRP